MMSCAWGYRPVHKVARAGVSRTFQTVRLFRDLTVWENVEVAALSVGKPRGAARALAEAAITELGLEDWRDQLASILPYGNNRRLEVARALAMAPDFLLLDEPAAGLNPQETEELQSLLRQVSDEGVTLLVVEHDMHFVRRLCEHVIVLNFGRKIFEGTPEELRQNDQIRKEWLEV